jgi:hypothetical protein
MQTARLYDYLCMLNFLIVMYVPFSVFWLPFVCKCVLYCCHRVSTQCVLYCCHRVSTKCVLYFCHRVSSQCVLYCCHRVSTQCVLYCCPRVSTKCVLYCCHRVSTQCVLYCCHRVSTQLQLNTHRVIHTFVKHFKNSQQTDYATIMVILTPIERETLQVCF